MTPKTGAHPAPAEISARHYVSALLGATRPHFFALSVGAALAGVAATGVNLSSSTLGLLALITGGGWACGQLLNDVLDREADAIDAPDRPAVRGLLPTKPTVGLALALGTSLLFVLTRLTPHGWTLGLISMVLILTYNMCKALPGVGNLSHGTVLACAALIGIAVAQPAENPVDLVVSHVQALVTVGLWGALYLQGNYEKDARGDEAAGYRTLAHLLGTRGSAAARAVAAPAFVWLALPLLTTGPALVMAASAALVVSASAVWVAMKNNHAAALAAYRGTVHGATIGMLAFGSAALSPLVFLVACAAAVTLTELAFRRSPNP